MVLSTSLVTVAIQFNVQLFNMLYLFVRYPILCYKGVTVLPCNMNE